MKAKFTTITLISLLFCCASCKKEKKGSDPRPTVEGYWKGLYGLGTQVPKSHYHFLFRANGTVRVYADNADSIKAFKAEGTYILTGTTVKTTYTYITEGTSFSTTAQLDADFVTMDGTFGKDATTSGQGTFRVFK